MRGALAAVTVLCAVGAHAGQCDSDHSWCASFTPQVAPASASNTACGASSPDSCKSALLEWQVASVLAQHNLYREKHGACPMTYNNDIAAYTLGSAGFATTCQGSLTHNSGSGYGENIAMVGRSGIDAATWDPAEGVKNWYCQEEGCYNYNNGGFSGNTGHMTQVVWKKSLEIGCAVCHRKNPSFTFMSVYVMCNYKEPGNYGSQYDENVLPPLTVPSGCAGGSPTPLTPAPPTSAPATPAPPTPAPVTPAPPTPSPATSAPPTPSPPTPAPSTSAPPTPAPPTSAPSTPSPPTPAPPTSAPLTPAPATQTPTTPVPLTPAPPTPAPATPSPATPAPLFCEVPDTAAGACGGGMSQRCVLRILHTGSVLSVAHSPNGMEIMAGGADGVVRVFNAATGAQLRSLACGGFAAHDVSFSPDGARVAVGGAGGRVVVCDATTGVMLLELEQGNVAAAPVRRVRFSPDGRLLLAGGVGEDVARVHDAVAGMRPELVLPRHVRELAFAPAGAGAGAGGAALVATVQGEAGEAVRIFALDNGQQEAAVVSVGAHVTALSFSPSGDELARGMDDGTVRVGLWAGANSSSSERLRLVHGSGFVLDVQHSPDGRLVAAAGVGPVVVWGTSSGAEVAEFVGHAGGVRRLSFSPSGTRVATAGHDGQLLVWDVSGL